MGELEAAAKPLCDLARAESPPFLAWGEYGLALAAMRRSTWGQALELATSAFALARKIGELPVVFRAAATAATALSALSRRAEAEELRAEAAGVVNMMVESIRDDELRRSFQGRDDVAKLLASATQAPSS